MIEEYLKQIEIAFKSISGHLTKLKVKDFKYLKKLDYVANYTIEGEFTGYTKSIGDDIIQIPLRNITNRDDIKREINHQKEMLELDVMKALNKK